MVEWDAGLRLFFPSSTRKMRNTVLGDTAVDDNNQNDDKNNEIDQYDDNQVKKKKRRRRKEKIFSLRRNLRETGRNTPSYMTRRHASEKESVQSTYPARECNCASRFRNMDASYYCLVLNGENTCRIPVDKEQPIDCMKFVSSESFIRNSWPVAVLWLATMILYLITTTGGRFAVRYLCFKVRSCFSHIFCICCSSGRGRGHMNPQNDTRRAEWPNHHIINQIIAMQARAQRIGVRPRVSVMRLADENDASPRSQDSVTYILKTTQFNKKSLSSTSDQTLPMTPSSSASIDNVVDRDFNDNGYEEEEEDNDTFSDNDEILCTICLTSIDDGDRVGVLECDHLFHSECLKAWIRRKNRCPLCQTPDIAKEKEAVGTTTTTTTATNNNNNNNSELGASADGDNNNGQSPTAQRTTVRSTGVDVSSYHSPASRSTRTRIATLGTSIQRNLFRINDSGSSSNASSTSPRGDGGTGEAIQVVSDSTIGVGTVRIRMNLSDSNRARTALQMRESPNQRRARLNSMRQTWNPR
eukprot:CAMPEP_0176485974 /NCGR_PEP_ID=MMETSP0200_2-20121128/5324_1 /TAXON_ID=947934 /ORGANISM="Chaetoceros sp., Strain GSL56" /LENGTH=525 /DNA_ID=CAMNT_0017882651 /DNA_START=434 /DNA_END=2011 /DNA_ORIENTATION=+